jgi:rare lipoprotein A
MSRAYLVLAVALLGLPACMHDEDPVEFARSADPDRASTQAPIATARGAGGPLDIGPPAAPIENAELPPPIAYRAGDDIVISAARSEGAAPDEAGAPRAGDNTVISVVRGEGAATAASQAAADASAEQLEGGSRTQTSDSAASLRSASDAASSQPGALRGTLPAFEENLAATRGPESAGQTTATGERFDPNMPMAAHPDMPLPSLAEIVNLENGRRMVVRVNDRPPATSDREVSVSRAVADELGFSVYPAHVSMRYLGPAPALSDGEQAPMQAASLPADEQAAAAAGAGFMVQVGAFSNPSNAERLREMLARTGEARIETTQARGRPVYRVRLGPWFDRAQAEAVRTRLLSSGYPDAVIAAR